MASLVWLLLIPLAAHADPDRPSDPHGAGFESSAKVPVVADSGVTPDRDALRRLPGNAGDASKLLPPDQAFTVSISVKDANTLVAEFAPADDYYLYRDKFVFRVRALRPQFDRGPQGSADWN